jgi:hypothetical protein
LKDGGESLEQDLEEAVSRALRDNLNPLQRTADDLHQACADFVAACGSAKPSHALPALLRAQTAASSLAAALSVLSNFVVVSMKPPERQAAPLAATTSTPLADVDKKSPSAPQAASSRVESHVQDHIQDAQQESEWAERVPQVPVEPEELRVESRSVASYTELPLEPESEVHRAGAEGDRPQATHEALTGASSFEAAVPANAASEPAFDVASFPAEIQELHRRANRVAKVAMQDIKLLRPKDVQLGRENKDICERLRSELDKARKEYDRRFRAIQDHPVDYFHRWAVEILAGGNVEALGEYPYPSAVLRH